MRAHRHTHPYTLHTVTCQNLSTRRQWISGTHACSLPNIYVSQRPSNPYLSNNLQYVGHVLSVHIRSNGQVDLLGSGVRIASLTEAKYGIGWAQLQVGPETGCLRSANSKECSYSSQYADNDNRLHAQWNTCCLLLRHKKSTLTTRTPNVLVYGQTFNVKSEVVWSQGTSNASCNYN